jgi:hypothetical protein
MQNICVSDLIPVLQVAIGPVVLISGVGLLLLTMTNRLARVVDRTRILARELRQAAGVERPYILAQLDILTHRANLLQRAIILAAASVLLAAILIILLFITALLGLEAAWFIAVIFSGCMLSLIVALIEFIRDIIQSLVAVKVEVDECMAEAGSTHASNS